MDCLQLVRQLALLVDQPDDLALAILQIAQILQLLFDRPQLVLIQLAGHFLTVAGDKRNRIAFIQQARPPISLCSAAG